MIMGLQQMLTTNDSVSLLSKSTERCFVVSLANRACRIKPESVLHKYSPSLSSLSHNIVEGFHKSNISHHYTRQVYFLFIKRIKVPVHCTCGIHCVIDIVKIIDSLGNEKVFFILLIHQKFAFRWT